MFYISPSPISLSGLFLVYLFSPLSGLSVSCGLCDISHLFALSGVSDISSVVCRSCPLLLPPPKSRQKGPSTRLVPQPWTTLTPTLTLTLHQASTPTLTHPDPNHDPPWHTFTNPDPKPDPDPNPSTIPTQVALSASDHNPWLVESLCLAGWLCVWLFE